MELDVRWYDELLNKFWYPSDHEEMFIDHEKGKKFLFLLGMDLDTLSMIANIYEIEIDGSYANHRVLTKKDRFTGLYTDEKIYESDILHREVKIIVYGSHKEPYWVHDWEVPYWNKEYSGFYVGERPLFSELNRLVDSSTGCPATYLEKVGNIHQNSDLINKYQENDGKVDYEVGI